MSNDIDVNGISEALNDKLDRDLKNSAFNMDLVIAYKAPTAEDPTWYRQYKSGWVEQGGTHYGTNSATVYTINLPVTMQNTDYNITLGCGESNSNTSVFLFHFEKTTTTFKIYSDHTAAGMTAGDCWEVKGFAANPASGGGDDESTYGNVYKTYYYRNTDLDYANAVGPYYVSQMASYQFPKSGVIMGWLNPDNSNNGRLKINNLTVWGADYYITSVYIPVKVGDVLTYTGIDSPTSQGQLYFIPYLEPSQSTDPSVTTLVDAMWPVGSIYIGTTVNCPLASIVGTWTKIDGDLVLQSSSQEHQANTKINAGLPNIKGWFDIVNTTQKDNVLFQSIGTGSNSGSTGGGTLRMQFNANKYNSIYQDDSTVQPPAYVVNVWRRTA